MRTSHLSQLQVLLLQHELDAAKEEIAVLKASLASAAEAVRAAAIQHSRDLDSLRSEMQALKAEHATQLRAFRYILNHRHV